MKSHKDAAEVSAYSKTSPASSPASSAPTTKPSPSSMKPKTSAWRPSTPTSTTPGPSSNSLQKSYIRVLKLGTPKSFGFDFSRAEVSRISSCAKSKDWPNSGPTPGNPTTNMKEPPPRLPNQALKHPVSSNDRTVNFDHLRTSACTLHEACWARVRAAVGGLVR